MKTIVLISSCDGFLDCWEPMIYSIKKHWPDCPFPIYFVSNYKSSPEKTVTFLKVGKDLGFASNLKNALKMVDCEYVIYLQEDYFIDNAIDNFSIMNHIQHCKDNNIDLLKIDDYTVLRDNLRIKDTIYCENPIDIKYSLDTSAAIWKKSLLEQVCLEGYSGWDFERKIVPYIQAAGIKINSEIIHSSLFPQKGIKYVKYTAVTRGRWTRDGVRFLRENGFDNIISNRKVEGKLSAFFISLYSPLSILRIPISLIIKILQKINL